MADKGGDRAAAFSLKDHLFNADTLGQLAAEYAAGLPGFPAEAFLDRVLPGLAERGLLERIDWIADCIEPHLAPDFPTMADQVEAAMPPPLDPSLTDDDFGQFIHAIPGVLAVRHGMSEAHLPRALDLLEAATQRFSMEFYIRPFLNAFPGPVMARLTDWTGHANYHVRRLVSEGTRPTLPWAKRIDADPLSMLPLLDALHADPTRYVTRSVANHLNDIAKIAPDRVLAPLVRLDGGRAAGRGRNCLDDEARAPHAGQTGASGRDGGAGLRSRRAGRGPVLHGRPRRAPDRRTGAREGRPDGARDVPGARRLRHLVPPARRQRKRQGPQAQDRRPSGRARP
jgi:3-methyladenine DNA glycosylase AlkC